MLEGIEGIGNHLSAIGLGFAAEFDSTRHAATNARMAQIASLIFLLVARLCRGLGQ